MPRVTLYFEQTSSPTRSDSTTLPSLDDTQCSPLRSQVVEDSLTSPWPLRSQSESALLELPRFPGRIHPVAVAAVETQRVGESQPLPVAVLSPPAPFPPSALNGVPTKVRESSGEQHQHRSSPPSPPGHDAPAEPLLPPSSGIVMTRHGDGSSMLLMSPVRYKQGNAQSSGTLLLNYEALFAQCGSAPPEGSGVAPAEEEEERSLTVADSPLLLRGSNIPFPTMKSTSMSPPRQPAATETDASEGAETTELLRLSSSLSSACCCTNHQNHNKRLRSGSESVEDWTAQLYAQRRKVKGEAMLFRYADVLAAPPLQFDD